MQNRVSSAMAALPQSVQVQGVNVQKKSTAILEIVTLTSPDGQPRQPLSQQLRDDQAEGRDRPPARRRQRQCVRRRPVFDAHLARSRQDAGARPDGAGRHPGAAAAERAGHRRPGRRAAGAGRTSPSSTRSTSQSRLDDPDQFGAVIVKTGDGGDMTRVRDIGRVELGAQTYGQFFNARRQAGRRPRHLPVAGRQRARRGRMRSSARMEAAGQGIPARRDLRHPVQHHDLRQPGDRRGLQDADRSGACWC